MDAFLNERRGAALVTHAMPWFSAFTAVTELGVTAAIFYVLYHAVIHDDLKTRVLAVALAYEVAFNISYMTWRLFTHVEPQGHHPDWMIGIVAGHGALSLLMFLGLVALAVVAFRWDRRERNLFAEKRGLTWTFAGLWIVSILSGEAIFLLEYVGHV